MQEGGGRSALKLSGAPTSSLFTSSAGGLSLREALGEKDEILLDFVVSEREITSRRRRALVCCEGLTKAYVLWLVYVLRVCVALILASVFLYQPAISALMPRSLFFLVLLSASLSVRPFLGMAIVSVYGLPLSIGTQWCATGVALIMPVHAAFSAFIIFLGIFLAHWVDLPPGQGKIMSAIWMLTMIKKQLTGIALVSDAVGFSVGLCLAVCAVLCAQLLPPLTVKKVVDGGLEEAGASLAEMMRLLGKEFARSHKHKRFEQAAQRAHHAHRTNSSLPNKMLSQPGYMRSFVAASSGHGFHTADRLEKADSLQETAQQGLDRLAMLPFLQAERPFGSMAGYAAVGATLRETLARVREMREALPDLEAHRESRIGNYRVALAPVLTQVIGEASELLSALGQAAGDAAALAAVPGLQERLRERMETTRVAVEEIRRVHFGAEFRELFRGTGAMGAETIPTRPILATHVIMQNVWQVCLLLLAPTPGPSFIPLTAEPVRATMQGWLNMWATKAPPPRDYVNTRSFQVRMSNALIVSLAVAVSLCFVYIPELKAIFTQGTWVSLTALFVFTQNSGATLRAARDRLLGIFVGTSYAFIALLILRYTADPLSATPPVALTVFIVAFVAVVYSLMQDSLGLAMASSYAVILMLNALPPDTLGQNALILANFMNTFIGAVMVTIFSSWTFFVYSSRVELSNNLATLTRQFADALNACAARFDYEALTAETIAGAEGLGKKILSFGAPIAQLELLLADVQVEPSLWRAPVREDQWQGIIQTCKKVMTELTWLHAATMGFVKDVQETREGGILDNNALPLLLGVVTELSDALGEAGMLLHLARHPKTRLKLAWRPEGIRMAQTMLVRNAVHLSMVENLFVMGKKEDLVATRQILSFSGTVFALDKLASSVNALWLCAFHASSGQRRASLFFAKSHADPAQ